MTAQKSENSPLLDPNGERVQVGDDRMVRVDGIIAFRIVERGGKPTIQFCDKDRLRSACRGTRYVEVPIDALIDKLTNNAKG